MASSDSGDCDPNVGCHDLRISTMPDDRAYQNRGGLLHGLSSLGGRAATATMRPVNDELERALIAVMSSDRVHDMLRRALNSDAALDVIDDFFDSGLFDRFAERLLESDALWHLIDEIAASPAVTAAISGQGLSFADQLGGELRSRSRRADVRLERIARRLSGRDGR